MIILKCYQQKVKERKKMGLETQSNKLKLLLDQYKNGEINDNFLMQKYIEISEQAENDYIDMCYEKYCEDNHDDLRDEFEENLLEHGYAIHTVSEVNDGRDDFCRDSFCDEYFGKDSGFFTTREQYKMLLENFKL